jgi:hypothetical protein
LLATFERHLPLRLPSHLADPDLARRILTMAGGLIGGIATILRQSAVAAIKSGHERIDRSVLDGVVVSSPERIEAVATAADL